MARRRYQIRTPHTWHDIIKYVSVHVCARDGKKVSSGELGAFSLCLIKFIIVSSAQNAMWRDAFGTNVQPAAETSTTDYEMKKGIYEYFFPFFSLHESSAEF